MSRTGWVAPRFCVDTHAAKETGMTSRTTSRSPLLVASLCLLLATPALAQTPPAPREGDVSVADGVRIHYAEAGDRRAKVTLLFVPGWSCSSAVLRDQLAAFAPRARVVAIDPRSQGQSTVTVRANTPEQRAQDLRQVIRALDLTSVVLVGWSQGVQDVAAYAAAFEGEAIAGYVLVDSAVGAGAAVAVSRPEALKQELELMADYVRYQKEYLQGMMKAIIRSPEGRKRADEFVEIGLRTPPDVGVSMLLMDFTAVDRRPALARFNRPTLIVAAAQSDELEAQREMAKQIKGSRIEVIADAGHAVFLDQPERFRELLAGFVGGLGKP
jgi:non-heme chloroperoxidase